VLGFGPTLRKAYAYPHEESLQFYNLFIIRSFLSVFALETRNVTTVLFPSAMIVACFLVSVVLWWRRKTLAGAAAQKDHS
jgi:hypothetical protein